jgi:hypothetical protein
MKNAYPLLIEKRRSVVNYTSSAQWFAMVSDVVAETQQYRHGDDNGGQEHLFFVLSETFIRRLVCYCSDGFRSCASNGTALTFIDM